MKSAVIGLQWGDEGKGRVVDAIAPQYETIARYSGGPNAGHTLYINDEKHVLHVIPSGIFYPDKLCLITSGVILDLTKLVGEITKLQAKGVSCSNLRISPNCHLILPYHILLDQIREGRRAKLGTTKSGIGPCYADRTARIGIRIKDLYDDTLLKELLESNLEEKNPFFVAQGYLPMDVNGILDQLRSLRDIISPYLSEVRDIINDSNCLLEGAQGVMLDIDHGTYPHVTSSQCSYAGILAGTGLPAFTEIDVIGVVKAYNTRVGTGPFPTEEKGSIGESIRTIGKEFGSTTGRPRRCGWLDIPQLLYAIELSGARSMVMTKLDVLSGFPEIKICTQYQNFKSGTTPDWDSAVPVYETLPGFTLPAKLSSWDDLPQEALHFINSVEDLAGIPITYLSFGPKRKEMLTAPGVLS